MCRGGDHVPGGMPLGDIGDIEDVVDIEDIVDIGDNVDIEHIVDTEEIVVIDDVVDIEDTVADPVIPTVVPPPSVCLTAQARPALVPAPLFKFARTRSRSEPQSLEMMKCISCRTLSQNNPMCP